MYAILSNLMAALQSYDGEDRFRNSRWTSAWHVIDEACKYHPDVAFGGFVQPMLRLRPSQRAKAPQSVADKLIEYGQLVDVLPGGPTDEGVNNG